ncbi:anaphase-promoting complex subunit 5-domain-containing protein [Dipodascopsis tothii]|uniref:anaphase-promoting complex subunit 5-domain-containing protein n=1 Tax=Dipodascopsis tothii TaxID=44089 RepID=UPI0034CD5868
MPRDAPTAVPVHFLTPAKIVLVSLIRLYVEHWVPVAHRLRVLRQITAWLDAKDSRLALLAMADFRAFLGDIPSTVPDHTIYQLIMRELWDLGNLDEFHYAMKKINSTFFVAPRAGAARPAPAVHHKSLLGHFLRKCYLEFSSMDFDDRIVLWGALVKYRQASWPDYAPIESRVPAFVDDGSRSWVNPEFSHMVEDAAAESVAAEDVTKLLEFQISYLQKHGCSLPDRMRADLQAILGKLAQTPSQTHYIRFLDAWRSGDYQEAFENLHRYFDHTMHNRDGIFYQYALLNLAILQCDFSCFREALWAIQETIKTARQNKDAICLNFSLSWLHHFQKTHPDQCPAPAASDEETLQFLKARSKESGMANLQSISYLSEARSLMFAGGDPTLVFEAIAQSALLNGLENLVEPRGAQFLIVSTFWTRLGYAALGSVHMDIFLTSFDSPTLLDDMVKTACRAAFTMAAGGQADAGERLLDAVEPSAARSFKMYQFWFVYKVLLEFKRAVAACRLASARELGARLEAMPGADIDCDHEIVLARVELELRAGNTAAAADLVAAGMDRAVADGADVYSQLSLMLTHAHLLAQTDGQMRSYSLLMRCIAVAERACVVPVMLEAYCRLCALLVATGQHERVLAILDAVFPQLMETEACAVLGLAYTVMTDALVGASRLADLADPADPADSATAQARASVEHAVRYAGLAYDEYAKVGDLAAQIDLSGKRARLHQVLVGLGAADAAVERDRLAALNLELRAARRARRAL